MGEQCDPSEIVERLGRAMANDELRRWLTETMQAFAAALAGVSERRMADIVASLFMAQVGSSIYAAYRVLGRSSREALEEAEKALCRIYRAALTFLRESFNAGKLEEEYRRSVRSLAGEGGEEKGS